MWINFHLLALSSDEMQEFWSSHRGLIKPLVYCGRYFHIISYGCCFRYFYRHRQIHFIDWINLNDDIPLALPFTLYSEVIHGVAYFPSTSYTVSMEFYLWPQITAYGLLHIFITCESELVREWKLTGWSKCRRKYSERIIQQHVDDVRFSHPTSDCQMFTRLNKVKNKVKFSSNNKQMKKVSQIWRISLLPF